MQLTKFDRWLKERFIYETHIYTLRLPENRLPRRVKVVPLERGTAGEHNFQLIIPSKKVSDRVIKQLKAEHLMYTTRVVEGSHWYNSTLSPKGKSFTYRWIFRVLSLISIACVCWYVYQLSKNEGLVELLDSALRDLKGGP